MKRPILPRDDLIPETDSDGISSEERLKRLWVLLELKKLDRQKKYLQDELRKRKLGFNITYRRSESFQCLLKACRTHERSIEHMGTERQTRPATHCARGAHAIGVGLQVFAKFIVI